MRSPKGFALLEALLVCAGVVGMMTLLIGIFVTTADMGSQLRNQQQLAHGAIILTSVASDAIREFDEHPLQTRWRIHPAGMIRLADGSPNAIMKGRRTPNSKSSALTSFSAMTAAGLDIVKSESFNNKTKFRVCRRYSATGAPLRLPRNYLGVGLTTNSEYALPGSKEIIRRGRCFSLVLRPVQGMLASLPAVTIDPPLILLPLARIYTIYLDRAGTLRYLGHSGTRNLENQPLLTLPRSATLAFADQNINGIQRLTMELADPRGFSVVAKLCSHWAKAAPINFLLNRP
ncbi:MAG: hypothetical protein K1X83_07200 [Oligoflexia bacterium]|nr:hypothetical protein [Oligoflexia bacterium]